MDRYSREKILKNLENILPEFPDEDLELNVVSHLGFVSDILQLNIKSVYKNSLVVPENLIVKIPDIEKISRHLTKSSKNEEDQQRMVKFFQFAHKNECNMYFLFDRFPFHNLPLAKCYGFNKKFNTECDIPMIVLEDFHTKSATIGDFSKSLNGGQLLSVAEFMARLHIWSWKNCNNLAQECPSVEKIKPFFETWLKPTQQGLEDVKLMFPNLFDGEMENRILNMLKADNFIYLSTKIQPFKVLVHGDFHAMNILFCQDENKVTTSEIAAVLDWQFGHMGCIMEDFARLMVFSVNAETRKYFLDAMLKRYYGLVKHYIGISYKEMIDLFNFRFIKWSMFYLTLLPNELQFLCNSDDESERMKQRNNTIDKALSCFREAVILLNNN